MGSKDKNGTRMPGIKQIKTDKICENLSNLCYPCSIAIKKLAFCKKSPIFEPERADKFIQSFSLSGIQYSININSQLLFLI